MRTVRTTAVVVALALVLSSFAWAGVEPSPWTPATNVLSSVVNVLGQVDRHLLDVVKPPNPNKPPTPNKPPSPNIVNRLNALTMQLERQNERVEGVLAMVEGTPGPPDDFLLALMGVADGASGIAGDAAAMLEAKDDSGLPAIQDEAVREALGEVLDAANAIGETVGGYSPGTTPGH
jgi:hypothetical protein